MTFAQLWLTVIENHRFIEWPPTLDGQGWRVALTRSATLQGCTYQAPFRTSPVFPASADFVLPELDGRVVHFGFMCFDPAFPVLGKLLEGAPSEITSGLLFSLGLASIIYVGPEVESVARIEEIVGRPPHAKEIWVVKDSKIVSVECTCRQPVALAPNLLSVRPYDALPLAPRTAVDEFVASVALVVPKIALHLPTEIDTFVGLARLVDELVAEMVYVSNPVGEPPTTLSEYSADDFTRDQSLVEGILHQDTDRLVQVGTDT